MSDVAEGCLFVIFVFLLLLLVVGPISAVCIMWLWNALIPEIFGLCEIGFWQAWGLYLLSCFLVKSHTFNTSSKK